MKETSDVLEEEYKEEYEDDGPWDVDLSLFCQVMKAVGSKELKVLAHILENMDYDNRFVGSITDVSKDIGISRQTVAKAFKKLTDSGDLIKKSDYEWVISRKLGYYE